MIMPVSSTLLTACSGNEESISRDAVDERLGCTYLDTIIIIHLLIVDEISF